MKIKLLTLTSAILTGLSLSAQVFWTEDFGTGCSTGQLASAYTGTNGAWSISSTGTNDGNANTFFVSAAERGMGVGNCGAACGGTDSRTLHVGNTAIPSLGITADMGASYLSGGFCPSFSICATTNRRAESPVIDCTGKVGITLSMAYLENGDGANDDGSIWYSPDGGTTWSLLVNTAKPSLGACSPQGMWTAYSIMLPATANNNAFVKIGFQWTNNDDGVGTDPSFAIDDITLSTLSVGINEVVAVTPEIYVNDNNVIIRSSETVKLNGVYDVLGRNLNCGMDNNSIDMNGQPTGVYFVRVELKGKVYTKKVFLK